MMSGIDPKVDYAFKKVFGSESNTDLLTLLLEAVLGFRVSAVEIINPFNDKETPGDKLSVLDIKARDASGRLFDVEMQMFPHAAIIPRLIYYWAKLYTAQLEAGESFANLGSPPLLLRDDARSRARSKRGVRDARHCVHRRKGLLVDRLLRARLLHQPLNSCAAPSLSASSPARVVENDNPPMRKALEVLMRMSQDAQERERYESRLKFQRDMNQHHADAASAAASAMEKGSFQGEIKAFQFVLKQSQTPKQDLEKMSVQELQRLADELRQQIERLSKEDNAVK